MPLQYRKGTCTQCGADDVMIVKRMASGILCQGCNRKRLDKDKPKISPKSSFVRKEPTGEGALFLAIFNTRPHVSFVDKSYLGDEPCAWMFAHVLNKKNFPLFRLYDKNIVMLTFDQHYALDFGSQEELKRLPEWKPLFELKEKLKEEYKLLLK